MGARTPRALQTSSVQGRELALGLGGMDPPHRPPAREASSLAWTTPRSPAPSVFSVL